MGVVAPLSDPVFTEAMTNVQVAGLVSGHER